MSRDAPISSVAEIASAIRRRVRTELGLPISVGVTRTKHLAKIASQVAKPDGPTDVKARTIYRPLL
jgi:DNA polymerase IV